jgi:hypothetical protein
VPPGGVTSFTSQSISARGLTNGALSCIFALCNGNASGAARGSFVLGQEPQGFAALPAKGWRADFLRSSARFAARHGNRHAEEVGSRHALLNADISCESEGPIYAAKFAPLFSMFQSDALPARDFAPTCAKAFGRDATKIPTGARRAGRRFAGLLRARLKASRLTARSDVEMLIRRGLQCSSA